MICVAVIIIIIIYIICLFMVHAIIIVYIICLFMVCVAIIILFILFAMYFCLIEHQSFFQLCRNRGSGRISEPILNIELRHLEKQSLEPSTVMLNPSGPFAETSRAPDPSKEISSVSDPSVVQFQCNQSIENSFSKTDVFASPSLTPGELL